MKQFNAMSRTDWNMNNSKSRSETQVEEEIFAEELKIAKAEIGEDDKTKEQCLKQFREWINQNEDIDSCFTDDNFPLRFLRTKKYSLFMAQQMLLRYLNLRTKFGYLLDMMDYKHVKINELMSNGFMYAGPIRDSYGKRVAFYDYGKFDTDKFDGPDLARAFMIILEAMSEDEVTQVLGVNHILNLKGASGAVTTLFPLSELAKLILCAEKGSPMRHREVNVLNLNPTIKFIYSFAVSLLSQDYQKRFTVHNSQESFLNKVDRNCLPLELGGVMPRAEMIRLWNIELSQKRDRLLTYKTMKLLDDRGIVSKKNIGEHVPDSVLEGWTGSFRQLELD